MMFVSDNCAIYRQTKTPNYFWYKRELNFRHFIQLLKILRVELIETHNNIERLKLKKLKPCSSFPHI